MSFFDFLRPNVALVVESLDKGGLERVVVNLQKGLEAHGRKTYVVVAGSQLGPLAEAVPKNRLFVCHGKRLRFLWLLLKLRVGVVNYHYSALGLKFCRLLAVRSIYTIHSCYTWLDQNDFEARAGVIAMMDNLIAVSKTVKDYFEKRSTGLALSPPDIEVIPNGIDSAWFSAQSSKIACVENSSVRLMQIASIHPIKNQIASVLTLGKIRAAGREARLEIIGNVQDPEYLEKLQETIVAERLSRFVSLQPYTEQENLVKSLSKHGAWLLHLSHQEGCANVLMEFASLGLPILATDVGSATEVAAVYPGAVLVSPPHPNLAAMKYVDLYAYGSKSAQRENLELAEKASQAFLSFDTSVLQLSEAQRRRLDEEFSVSRMAQCYLEIYKD